jgi:hypothetical protein
MNALRLLWYCLWVAPHIVQGMIVFVMVRRRLQRQFPMFFLYTVFEILQFGVLFTFARSQPQFGEHYARLYSVGLGLSMVIRLGVIHEVFNHVFRDYQILNATGRALFRGTTVALLVVAVGLAASTPVNNAVSFNFPIHILDRTLSILQCGLLISLFIVSRYFSLSWRSPVFGIALGLGIFASVELASSAILSQIGYSAHVWLDLVKMGTYLCCVTMWMFYLLAPERRSQPVSRTLPAHDLEIWNRELQRLLQQ